VPVAQPSLSRTRSPEPQVVGEALADDACTATPPRGVVENVVTSPPVADARVRTPPRTNFVFKLKSFVRKLGRFLHHVKAIEPKMNLNHVSFGL
jgi:hypothetical protein